jgi:hypothetical protein
MAYGLVGMNVLHASSVFSLAQEKYAGNLYDELRAGFTIVPRDVIIILNITNNSAREGSRATNVEISSHSLVCWDM